MRDKKNDIVVLLVCGAILATSVQYVFVQLHILLSGSQNLWWSINAQQLESTGYMRYVKDAYYLFFAFLWPILVIRSRNIEAVRLLEKCLFFEMSLFVLGMLGHVVNPVPILILAGIRWMLLFHTALGFYVLAIAYDFWGGNSRNILDLFVFIFVATSSGFAILQLAFFHIPSFVGIRLPSLFSNAGVFAYAMVAASMYFLSRANMPDRMRYGGIGLAFIGSILSGTRMSMLSIFLQLVVSIFFRKKMNYGRLNFPLVVFLLMTIILFAIGFILPEFVALADRGNLLSEQLQKGGRVGNLIELVGVVENSPMINIYFGKGFGYGTNNAYILAPDLIGSDAWFRLIDNTFATFFLQFGIVGLVWFCVIAILFLKKIFLRTRFDASLMVRLSIIYLTVFAMLVAQNLFESYHFMLFLFMSLSIFHHSTKRFVSTRYPFCHRPLPRGA